MACSSKKQKSDLLRFTVSKTGAFLKDNIGKLHGRGIYCCNNRECLQTFISRKTKLAKALRVDVIQVNEELRGFSGVNDE